MEEIKYSYEHFSSDEIAVIILGDSGLNFWLNNNEKSKKEYLAKYGFRIYCVRGNHEERPENLGYEIVYDENVKGNVYLDPVNNKIRYFLDGGEYNINGHSVLTIGGAYSVDKHYRLARAGLSEETNDPKKSGWFNSEMLTPNEMTQISMATAGNHYDFVFTHTCPLSWEPTDLFLNFINQSTVDKIMEIWLDSIKDNMTWSIWCFAHFHADRIERPCVEQFYHAFQDLEVIWDYWNEYKENSDFM